MAYVSWMVMAMSGRSRVSKSSFRRILHTVMLLMVNEMQGVPSTEAPLSRNNCLRAAVFLPSQSLTFRSLLTGAGAAEATVAIAAMHARLLRLKCMMMKGVVG